MCYEISVSKSVCKKLTFSLSHASTGMTLASGAAIIFSVNIFLAFGGTQPNLLGCEILGYLSNLWVLKTLEFAEKSRGPK